jgi:hypothetical protein
LPKGHKLGDALDVKASIGLVVVAFLGTQTAYLLDKHVNGASHWLQFASVFCLTIATIFSVMELWPRNYWIIAPEETSSGRVDQLADFYSRRGEVDEDVLLRQLTEDEIEWARQRIRANTGKNNSKERWLTWAFRATAAALALNMITLFVVAVSHPF